jgi:hypothetical protein
VRRALGPALERLDAENVVLMGYFDVYLLPAENVSESTRRRLVRQLRQAIHASRTTSEDAPA